MPDPIRGLIIGAHSKIADPLIRGLLRENIDITATVGRDWIPEYADRIKIIRFLLDRPLNASIKNWMQDFDFVVTIPPITLLPSFLPTLKAFGVKRLICLSSHNVTLATDDKSYADTLQAEQTVIDSAIPSVILRPTMIVGHTRNNVGRLIDFCQKWRCLILPGPGAALQSPIDFRDVADALEWVCLRPAIEPARISIGGPEIVTLKTLYARIFHLCGRRARIIRLPNGPIQWGVKVARYVLRPLPTSLAPIARINRDKHVEGQTLPGWQPQIGLDKMITDLIENAPPPLT